MTASPHVPRRSFLPRIGRRDSLRHQLAFGATGSLLIKIVNIGLLFVSTVLLARLLGPADYGTYSFVLALVTLMALAAELGLPQLVLRQVAWYRAGHRWGTMRGLLIQSGRTVAAVSLTLAILAAIAAWLLTSGFTASAVRTFWTGLPLLPIVALTAWQLAALRGLGHVLLGQIPHFVLRPGAFTILLLAALVVDREVIGAATAMGLQVAASGVALAVGAAWLVRKLPSEARTETPVYETRQWIASAVPFMLIGGMQLINSNMDMLMLGALQPVAEVGVYRVAAQLALLVALPLTALNMAFGPQFARLWARGDRAKLQRLVTSSARAILCLSLPIGLALVVFGDDFVPWIFGREYVGATTPLGILCAGQLINAAMGSVGLLLSATGHESDAARVLVVTAIANVTLNACLIPTWGAAGAAVATALSFAVWNSCMALRLWQLAALDSTPIGFARATG